MLPSAKADALRKEGMPIVAWTVRDAREWDAVKPMRQPDLRGLRRVTGLKAWSASFTAGSPRSAARPGTPAPPSDYAANPFVAYDFLDIAEESGLRLAAHRLGAAASRGARTRPAPWRRSLPLYLKSHSQGEYIFDHSLGRRLRARRRALLSQAGRRLAVLAGDRAAAAGAGRRRRELAGRMLLLREGR
jgi:hypothetical protein